jgi:hypothetical protein
MPDRDAHSRSVGNEAAHQPSAEEPRAAEHADRGHDIAPSCWMPLSTIMERVLDDCPRKRWLRRLVQNRSPFAAQYAKVARVLS